MLVDVAVEFEVLIVLVGCASERNTGLLYIDIPVYIIEENKGKIHQSHCTNIDHSQYNNLECPEKGRNFCCTNNQTSTWFAKQTTAGDDTCCEGFEENPPK